MVFSFVNEGAVRLTGYDRAELLAMTPLHLNPDASEREYRQLVDSLLVDGASSVVRQAIETIDERIAEQMIPVLREALTNVARHARARSARVSVIVNDDVTLAVADDGIGVPAEVLGGHGVQNLVERARMLGGHSRLENRHDGGTLLTWRVPAVSDPAMARL